VDRLLRRLPLRPLGFAQFVQDWAPDRKKGWQGAQVRAVLQKAESVVSWSLSMKCS